MFLGGFFGERGAIRRVAFPPREAVGEPFSCGQSLFFEARLAEGADFSERGIVSPSARRGQEDSGIFRFAL